MKDYIKTGLILMAYMVVTGFLVALVYVVTKPKVDEADFKSKVSAIESVLKKVGTDELLVESVPNSAEKLNGYIYKKTENELFKAADGSKVLSPLYKFEEKTHEVYVITFSGVGFGGDVVCVGAFIKQDGVVTLNKIEVINYSNETPGLGANISLEQVKQRFSLIPGSGLENGVKVNKDAGVIAQTEEEITYNKTQGIVQTSDVMTGATITPRAVTNGINAVIEYLRKEGEI